MTLEWSEAELVTSCVQDYNSWLRCDCGFLNIVSLDNCEFVRGMDLAKLTLS